MLFSISSPTWSYLVFHLMVNNTDFGTIIIYSAQNNNEQQWCKHNDNTDHEHRFSYGTTGQLVLDNEAYLKVALWYFELLLFIEISLVIHFMKIKMKTTNGIDLKYQNSVFRSISRLIIVKQHTYNWKICTT